VSNSAIVLDSQAETTGELLAFVAEISYDVSYA
jgi:hypothetical protein